MLHHRLPELAKIENIVPTDRFNRGRLISDAIKTQGEQKDQEDYAPYNHSAPLKDPANPRAEAKLEHNPDSRGERHNSAERRSPLSDRLKIQMEVGPKETHTGQYHPNKGP